MRRWVAGSVWVLVLLVPGRAAGQGKVIEELWYESRTEQGKLGHLHFQARELTQGGQKLIRTVLTEELSYIRSGDPYKEKQEVYTVETPAGEVVELGYVTNLSKKQQLTVHGRVDGPSIFLRVFNDGKPTQFGQKIAWDKAALGYYAMNRLFRGKTLQPGQTFTVKEFNLSANQVVPTTFTVKGPEETSFGRERRRLVRLEQTYARALYLTKSTLWLDEAGNTVKMQEDTPLFGVVSYVKVSQETALASFAAKVADVEAPITVNRPITVIPRPPRELTVRVALEDDDNPRTLFAEDDRQHVVNADKERVELKLLANGKNAGRIPATKETPGGEYLDSNLFIRSDDVLVQKLAREAVGDSADPRTQIRLIRKWLKEKFHGDYEVPFATADEVARTLEGDCSEMGVLAAAMCRHLGIPSRVVFGLVYDSTNSGFGGHLWTEVYLDGAWEIFDPTGIVHRLQAAYIKIAAYSLKDVINPDTLPAVRRAFSGRMKVEVVESKN